MSEDDVDMLGADGSGRVDRDRRAPRFSWTPAYEATFFRSLCESVQLGLRENSSFKAEAWERAAQALQESHGAYPTKNHLINKSDNARKRFRLWRGLREDPDFIYNPKARTVTATEDAWRSHIEREPLSRALRGRPFDHEDYMETLYPDVIGSGGAPKRIMKPKRRGDGQLADDSDMPGTGIINLQSDQATSQQGLESPSNPSLSNSNTPTSRPSGPTLPSIPPPKPTGLPHASALTPPDEGVSQTRKRAQGDLESSASANNTPPRTELDPASSSSPEKRLRTSTGDEMVTTFRNAPILHTTEAPPISPTPPDASSGSQITPPPQATTTASSGSARTTAAPAASTSVATQPASSGKVVGDLVDHLATRNARQWREEAVDLFFRDFASEEMDLQVKVSQDMFSNDHTAMVFCKMPLLVREHWVKSLRDAHRT